MPNAENFNSEGAENTLSLDPSPPVANEFDRSKDVDEGWFISVPGDNSDLQLSDEQKLVKQSLKDLSRQLDDVAHPPEFSYDLAEKIHKILLEQNIISISVQGRIQDSSHFDVATSSPSSTGPAEREKTYITNSVEIIRILDQAPDSNKAQWAFQEIHTLVQRHIHEQKGSAVRWVIAASESENLVTKHIETDIQDARTEYNNKTTRAARACKNFIEKWGFCQSGEAYLRHFIHLYNQRLISVYHFRMIAFLGNVDVPFPKMIGALNMIMIQRLSTITTSRGHSEKDLSRKYPTPVDFEKTRKYLLNAGKCNVVSVDDMERLQMYIHPVFGLLIPENSEEPGHVPRTMNVEWEQYEDSSGSSPSAQASGSNNSPVEIPSSVIVHHPAPRSSRRIATRSQDNRPSQKQKRSRAPSGTIINKGNNKRTRPNDYTDCGCLDKVKDTVREFAGIQYAHNSLLVQFIKGVYTGSGNGHGCCQQHFSHLCKLLGMESKDTVVAFLLLCNALTLNKMSLTSAKLDPNVRGFFKKPEEAILKINTPLNLPYRSVYSGLKLKIAYHQGGLESSNTSRVHDLNIKEPNLAAKVISLSDPLDITKNSEPLFTEALRNYMEWELQMLEYHVKANCYEEENKIIPCSTFSITATLLRQHPLFWYLSVLCSHGSNIRRISTPLPIYQLPTTPVSPMSMSAQYTQERCDSGPGKHQINLLLFLQNAELPCRFARVTFGIWKTVYKQSNRAANQPWREKVINDFPSSDCSTDANKTHQAHSGILSHIYTPVWFTGQQKNSPLVFKSSLINLSELNETEIGDLTFDELKASHHIRNSLNKSLSVIRGGTLFPELPPIKIPNPISQALLGELDWSSQTVINEVNKIFTLRSHREVYGYFREWEEKAEQIAMSAFVALRESEMKMAGEKSFFRYIAQNDGNLPLDPMIEASNDDTGSPHEPLQFGVNQETLLSEIRARIGQADFKMPEVEALDMFDAEESDIADFEFEDDLAQAREQSLDGRLWEA